MSRSTHHKPSHGLHEARPEPTFAREFFDGAIPKLDDASDAPTRRDNSFADTDGGEAKETGIYYASSTGRIGRALTFILFGCSVLWYWQTLLNYVTGLTIEKLTGYPRTSDTLTITFESTLLVISAFFSWRGYFNFDLALLGSVVWLAVYVLTGCFVHLSEEKTLYIGLHCAAVLAGVACACWESFECGLAAAMPKPAGHWVNCGWGVSGVLAFLVWLIFSRWVWPKTTDISYPVWVCVGIGMALTLAASICLWRFRSTPTIVKRVNKMKEHIEDERNDPDRPSYWALFKQTWPFLTGIFVTFFITFWATPNISPFRMPLSGAEDVTFMMGTLQISYFVGNWLCALTPLWRGFMPNDIVYHCMNYGRILFLALFIVMWRVTNVELFTKLWFQILILAIFGLSYGWLVSIGFTKAPLRLDNERYRGRVGSMCAWFMIFGIVLGLWISKCSSVIAGEGW